MKEVVTGPRSSSLANTKLQTSQFAHSRGRTHALLISLSSSQDKAALGTIIDIVLLCSWRGIEAGSTFGRFCLVEKWGGNDLLCALEASLQLLCFLDLWMGAFSRSLPLLVFARGKRELNEASVSVCFVTILRRMIIVLSLGEKIQVPFKD